MARGRKAADLTGQKFGRLLVIERSATNSKQNKPRWICKCDCGNEAEVNASDLKTGNTKSCGCFDVESVKARFTTHGQRKTKLYFIWCNMKDRCQREKNKRYADWGGRGIKVCPEWQNYEAFHEWAIQNGYEEGLSIDRINNDGNYQPSNCRWITRSEQNANKRKTYKKSP